MSVSETTFNAHNNPNHIKRCRQENTTRYTRGAGAPLANNPTATHFHLERGSFHPCPPHSIVLLCILKICPSSTLKIQQHRKERRGSCPCPGAFSAGGRGLRLAAAPFPPTLFSLPPPPPCILSMQNKLLGERSCAFTPIEGGGGRGAT